jgi:CheY-like chemotaxis protein
MNDIQSSLKIDDAPLSVLIVEDEEYLRELLNDLLLERGCQVQLAANGLEGLELINKESFDIVLTDIYMPEMDGMTLIRIIKELDRNPLPIFAVITGTPIHDVQGLAELIDTHIMKPFRDEELDELFVLGYNRRQQSNFGATG